MTDNFNIFNTADNELTYLKKNDIQPERRRNDHGLGGVLLAGGSLEVGRRSEQVLLSRLGVGLERGGGEDGGQAAGGGQHLVGSLRVQKRSNADICVANEERLREKLFVGPLPLGGVWQPPASRMAKAQNCECNKSKKFR